MDRLLTRKIHTFCINHACLARTLKSGRSLCAWQGYLNCEFRNTKCSCISSKQLRREFRAVRNCINTSSTSSSHILGIRTTDDREWILLRPKSTHDEQRRESSSDSDGNGDQQLLLRLAAKSLTMMIVLGLLLYKVRYPGGQIPLHVGWEEFERNYLEKGLVKGVVVYSSLLGRVPEVPYVKLYPSGMSNQREIIVDTYYAADFRMRLYHFEQEMKVPAHNRIPIWTVPCFHYAENSTVYTLVVGGMATLFFLYMLTFCQKMRRLSPEFLKKQINDIHQLKQEAKKQFEEGKKEYKEDKKKNREKFQENMKKIQENFQEDKKKFQEKFQEEKKKIQEEKKKFQEEKKKIQEEKKKFQEDKKKIQEKFQGEKKKFQEEVQNDRKKKKEKVQNLKNEKKEEVQKKE